MMKRSQSRKTKNRKNSVETTDLEIAKLQEHVRLLQLENNILRQNLEELEKKVSDNVTSNVMPDTSSKSTPKSSVGKSNCGCKGKCSSKICGCVKRNSKCNSSCKCNNTICQNQEAKRSDENKENKENVNKNYMETPKKQTPRRTKTNITAKETKKTKSIFSPEECKSEVTFDPMKPRHQLSRTPPSMKKIVDDILVNKDDTIKTLSPFQSQSQSCCKSVEEKLISSNTEEIVAKEEAVNWEQHTAQLVPCKKCKRTFMPDRIQKHEACCKKI